MFSNIQINCLKNTTWLQKWTQQFIPSKVLSQCGFNKRCGANPVELLRDLIALAFIDTPLYLLSDWQRPHRSVYYEFLSRQSHNWRDVLYLVALPIIDFLASLTSPEQKKVLIVDDTSIKRNRSKVVEYLGHQFDHCSNTFFKGFRKLTLCWSDGHSLIPLEFELLTNAQAHKRIGPDPQSDLDQPVAKRIHAATQKATTLMVLMVKNAFSKGIKADYLVFDSWFAHAKTLSELTAYIPVVCMVKKNPKQLYKLGGRIFSAASLYQHCVKNRNHYSSHRWGKLQAQKVHMLGGPPVKLVFITDTKDPENWNVIACTDLEQSAEEIAKIYAKRWHIEEFFKHAKQHLGMQNECESRKFATLIAHFSIVLLRYMMLEYANRQHKDEKTIPGIFRAHKEELQAMALIGCIQIILSEVVELLHSQNPTQSIVEFCQKFDQIQPHDLSFSGQNNCFIFKSES